MDCVKERANLEIKEKRLHISRNLTIFRKNLYLLALNEASIQLSIKTINTSLYYGKLKVLANNQYITMINMLKYY